MRIISIKFNRLILLVPILLGACMILSSCADKRVVNGGRELGGLKVPKGFTIEDAIAPDLKRYYPMFGTLDGRGRLYLAESNGKTYSTKGMIKKPTYFIRLMEDTNGDGVFDKGTIFADSLIFPMGAEYYNGSLYVASPPNLLRLTDTDGDGVADQKEIVMTGWTLNSNAAALHGPVMGPGGWLYMSDARRGFDITTKEGEHLQGKSARIWRIRPNGTGLEWVSGGGFDDGVEVTFMPSGEIIGTITYFTNPKNGYRDALMHWVWGGVYPKPQSVIQEDNFKLTGALMPVMDSLARVSPSGLVRYRGLMWGQKYQDNIFYSEFNTGKITRSIVIPDGATYRTIDKPFMTSTNNNTHPTDVLEAADGSLLVVVTGGWFIAGCPLSVVAKPEIKGGVYRIRKKDAQSFDDPRGKQISFQSISPQELTKYMADPRPVVRDKAVNQLVNIGQEAISPLKEILSNSNDERVRTEAVFVLYRIWDRIGGQQALTGMRSVLNDASSMVRDAAARVLGMAEDGHAVDKLMAIVQHDDSPAVRRQAATALGQIGNGRAVKALLRASDNPTNDRFVNHAIRYALITLHKPQPLMNALGSTSVDKQITALIVLDQMDGSPLEAKQVVPFLNSSNKRLQQTGIWVASHHLSWSPIVAGFLTSYYSHGKLNSNASAVFDLMVKFSGKKGVQDLIADKLGSDKTSKQRKSLFIDAIKQSRVTNVPPIWVNQLERILTNNKRLRTDVLSIISSKNIPALDAQLSRIIRNPELYDSFRLKAISAKLVSNPQLSNEGFQLILGILTSQNTKVLQRKAAQVIAKADLNESQLITLAQKVIPTAKPFLLPSLINTFISSDSRGEQVGKALAGALKSSPDRLANLSLMKIKTLFSSYPSTIQTMADPIINQLKQKQASRLKKLKKIKSKLNIKKGNVAKGRALFFSKGTCFKCHAVEGVGGTLGPDLTDIGAIRSVSGILGAIIYPSANFFRGDRPSKITTKTKSYIGIIQKEYPDIIVVATDPKTRVKIPRSDIVSIKPRNISMMPKGLNNLLTTQELTDLMAYLTSLPYGMVGESNFYNEKHNEK